MLYEKLNEAKKKLETSKLALKTSKTNFEDYPPKDSEKRTFFTRKNLDFLDEREDFRVDKPPLAKSNILPDEFSGKKSQHVLNHKTTPQFVKMFILGEVLPKKQGN